MTKFVVYDSDTGEILRTGTSPHPEKQAGGGEDVLVGHSADPETQRISKSGRIITKPKQDIEAIESRKAWRELRANRSYLLSNSDWTQMPDSPVDSNTWATYRQALRDLPQNTTDPKNPPWPERPE